MSIVSFGSQGFFAPGLITRASTYGVSDAGRIDATGEKIALIGRFWNPTLTAKSIRSVSFKWNFATKAGGSGLILSLQDVDTANGPPMRPDGTQDQTVAISAADSGVATLNWYTTGNLSADRSVSPGDLLAVVLEYDGGGRLGSDQFSIADYANPWLMFPWIRGSLMEMLYTASWAAGGTLPNIVFNCSDGSLGTFFGATVWSTTAATNIQSDTSPDEAGLKFVPDHDVQIDAIWANILIANVGADFDLILYDSGGSVLESKSFIPETMCDLSGYNPVGFPLSTLRTLSAGSTYYVVVKPTQDSQNVTLPYYEVNTVDYWPLALQGGPGAMSWVQRTDGGAWSETTTRRPQAGVRISGMHATSGGGSGTNFFIPVE